MSEQVVEQVDQPTPTLMETPSEVADGGSGNDFLNLIPEELREHPSLSPIKDVGNLARSYVNAQRLIGADKVPLPSNPTDEDLDRIYSRLGTPEKPDGYEVTVDGNIITEEAANSYKDIAHKLRLTPEQANGVLEYYKSVANNNNEQIAQLNQESREKTENDLKKEWGQAYEQKISAAGKIISEFASTDILEMRLEDGTPVGNHPDFIKAFANIADFRQSVTSEDTISNTNSVSAMTPKEAESEINAIMNSPEYTDRKNYVARQRAVERVQELMGMIHG